MATTTHTKTIKLTGYTSCTVTYTVTTTDAAATIAFTKIVWANTRSGGTTEAISWRADCVGSGTSGTPGFPSMWETGTASKGSKTWSKTLSGISKSFNKQHSAVTAQSVLHAYMENSSGFWLKDASVSVSIPAKTSYKVTLDANGGTGGTASLTKWHGEALDLTRGFTAPTRTGYRFEGWAATSGGSAIASYGTDQATTLYAVWTPIITGVSLDVHTLRVENGSSTSESDDGAYCYGTADYAVTGGAAGTLSLTVAADDSSVVFDSGASATVSKSADTTLRGTLVFRAHNCTTESNIKFTVSASVSNTSASGEAAVTSASSDVLSAAYFPMDILGDAYWDAENQTGERPGHGIAFGLPAKKEGFAVGMDLFFQQWAGVIQMFGGSTPPAGWLLCDGSAVSRTDYATLFAAIGTTWGAGDGSTTFNLPDLRGRAPIGAGTGSGLTARTLGGKLGSENAIVPYHRHTMGAHTHTNPGDAYLTNPQTVARRTVASGSGATNQLYSSGATSRANNTGAMNGTPYTEYAGTSGNTTGANMQPSAVVNFIIHTGKTN